MSKLNVICLNKIINSDILVSDNKYKNNHNVVSSILEKVSRFPDDGNFFIL
jgi:hypothetical protein